MIDLFCGAALLFAGKPQETEQEPILNTLARLGKVTIDLPEGPLTVEYIEHTTEGEISNE